jgi:hypothetical protein
VAAGLALLARRGERRNREHRDIQAERDRI